MEEIRGITDDKYRKMRDTLINQCSSILHTLTARDISVGQVLLLLSDSHDTIGETIDLIYQTGIERNN